jgi:hypothetical protein
MDFAASDRTWEGEAAAAQELASLASVPTPRPVVLGQPGRGYPLPWSVQTWLPGTDATVLDPGSRSTSPRTWQRSYSACGLPTCRGAASPGRVAAGTYPTTMPRWTCASRTAENSWTCPDYGDLPAPSRGEARAGTATADYAAGWIDEFVQAKASGAEAAMLTDFGERPLVVLTAGAETNPTHDAAQTQLATLSTDSSHRVVEGSSHAGLVTDEQYAKATTRAVLDVVASVRSAASLAR